MEHRHADRCFHISPAGKRGVLHSTLAQNYAGVLRKLKMHMKAAATAHFTWHANSPGPGREADEHRELVMQHSMAPQVSTSMRLSHSAKSAYYYKRKQLFNGDIRRPGRVDHHCRGCCRSAEHALETMHAVIDEEIGPPNWNPNIGLVPRMH